MSITAHSTPLRYDPSVEVPAEGEAATAAAVRQTMRRIQETTFADYGHAVRSVHAKSHALLEGEVRVLDGLTTALAQGMFARPGTYPVVLRLSTNPGDVLDDAVSSPRGLAVKVVGVQGERLEGSEGDATQDFVLVNAPAFAAPDLEAFAGNLNMLAATTDTGQAWKRALSAAMRAAEGAVEALGGKSPMLTTMGGQPATHPLGETFYSQVPFRHGDDVAKYSVAPVSPELLALKDSPVALHGRPNALREEAIRFFREHGGEWEVRVQLRTNPETMPVEDASVIWPEEESPYMPVARITVPPQPAWSEARAGQADDSLSFSPWHGLAAHRPLGGINRARKEAYREAAGFRAARNRCPIHEPRDRVGLSAATAQVYGTARGREGRRPNTPDGRPGALTQPMNHTARHVVAGAAGGLAAGLVLTAIMLGTSTARGEPSETVRLQRRTAGRLGLSHRHDEAAPMAWEEASSQGGHLALSAASGAVYGLVRSRAGGAPPAAAGLLFGLAFHALAYGMVGPALRVAPAPWRDSASGNIQHGVLHAVFGVLTGVVADRVARRL